MKTLSSTDASQAFADDFISGPGVVPQILLPSQADHGAASVAARNPEARLMLAVLDDAIAALARTRRGMSTTDRQERVELEAWFSSDDRSSLFSFETICAVLDLDPQALRKGISTWQPRGRRARRLRHDFPTRVSPRDPVARRETARRVA
jgi:hypothetical protein